MSISYNLNIPNQPNNPSNDQPLMKTNTNAVNTIMAIDHIAFNTANSGTHQQVHLPAFTNPAVINGTATQGSVIYSAAGTADATNAQAFFKNANNLNFPMSFIRAAGAFDGAGNSLNSFNITSVVPSAGPNFTYRVNLPANVVTGPGTNYLVIATAALAALNPNVTANYNIIDNSKFDLVFRSGVGSAGTLQPTAMSILVLQI